MSIEPTQIKEGARYRRRDGTVTPALKKIGLPGAEGIEVLKDEETGFIFPTNKSQYAGRVFGPEADKDLMEEVSQQ